MNKVWEVVEREAREGSERRPRSYRKGMRDTDYRGYRKDSDADEAYECGYDDGYSDAMKKIFKTLRESD